MTAPTLPRPFTVYTVSDQHLQLDDFGGDVPSIAIAALAPILMPDHLRLRAVACLAIVLTAEEEDGRAMGLDDAEVRRRCHVLAAEQAERAHSNLPEA